MTIELEVNESDVIDQNEYADWYLEHSGTDIKRIDDADDGKCRVKAENGAEGTFDLISISIEWDGTFRETDIAELAENNTFGTNIREDWDCASIQWGIINGLGEPINVLFKLN